MNKQGVWTGINELDELIGGPLPYGTVVIVRGLPGAGKSTLCAQMMAAAIEKDRKCLYIPVEEPPWAALNNVSRCFPQDNRQHVDNMLHTNRLKISDILPDEDDSVGDIVSKFWDKILRDATAHFRERGTQECDNGLIVIDSLPALIDMMHAIASQKTTYRQYLRLLIHEVQRTWRLLLSKAKGVVVCTDEAEPGQQGTSASESFLADVVIELTKDTLPIQSGGKKHVYRRFLSITKARGLNCQQRRSCYDFTSTGLQLYPTYAADGRVLLFWENESQSKFIDEMDQHEFPELYPNVQVERFTKSAMQTTFSVRQRVVGTPTRTPMVLTNIDEYWLPALTHNKLLQPIPKDSVELYSSDVDQQIVSELVAKGTHLSACTNSASIVAVPFSLNVGLLAFREDVLREYDLCPPKTWSEVKRVCSKTKRKFLIETGTYDSCLAFMLEWLWSHGAVFSIIRSASKYEVCWEPGADSTLVVDALSRLNRWIFIHDIIPKDSRVDPINHQFDNWVFARHWYSTLINVLVTHDSETNELRRRASDQVDFRSVHITEIPVDKDYNGGHHPCWGEWYLAVQHGTENISLAAELIRFLMSTHHIEHRARSGAALPPVEGFYRRYGRSRCPGTHMTFNDFRDRFLKGALSRTRIVDYPRISGILYGCFAAVLEFAMSKRSISKLVDDTFREIDSLSTSAT